MSVAPVLTEFGKLNKGYNVERYKAARKEKCFSDLRSRGWSAVLRIKWKNDKNMKMSAGSSVLAEMSNAKHYMESSGGKRNISSRWLRLLVRKRRKICFPTEICKIELLMTNFDDHLTSFLKLEMEAMFFEKDGSWSLKTILYGRVALFGGAKHW